MRSMLSARMSSLCACSVLTSVPYAYAQCIHELLMRMLSTDMSSLRTCYAYASVPYAYADGVTVYKMNIKNGKTDACTEHTHKELMRMLSECISS
jgi:hypothetical protein